MFTVAACKSGPSGGPGTGGSGGAASGSGGGGIIPTFGSGGSGGSGGATGTGGTTVDAGSNSGGTGQSGGAIGTGSGGNDGSGGASTGTASGGSTGTGSGGSMAGTGGAAPPACMSNPADYQYPFQDPCKPLETRVTDLLSRLTNDEKVSMLYENQTAVTRLGVPFFTTYTEGLHGVGWSKVGSNAQSRVVATQFPQAFGLAQTWDPEAMRIVGDTMGLESRVYYARWNDPNQCCTGIVIRAPVVDLARDPRWGRTEEMYGEDPYLVTELSKGFLSGLHGGRQFGGLQNTDTPYLMAASTLKHFLAYNNETNRNKSDSAIDDRNLREYYGVTFQELIKSGKADSIMTSYNKISGEPAAITPKVKNLLMSEWKFDGMVVTDAYALNGLYDASGHNYMSMGWSYEKAAAEVVKSGQLLCGGNVTNGKPDDVEALRRAVTMNLVTTADLDFALKGALRLRFRLGDLDPKSYVPYRSLTGNENPWNTPEYKARALDVSRRSVVLLKNAANALPLDKASLKNVAVIGPRGDQIIRDWYAGKPPYTAVTALAGIKAKLGTGVNVTFTANNNSSAAVNAAKAADVAIVVVGPHPICGLAEDLWAACPAASMGYEGREGFDADRTKIGLMPDQQALVEAVYAANPKTIMVLLSGYPQGVKWAADNVPAIVHISNSGQEIGSALADVLFGDYNPGGRTTMTWYASEADIPTSILDYDIRKGKTYLYFKGTPVFPFGHGLSYTTFKYENLAVSGAGVSMNTSVNVSVDVTNSGTRAGDEVVQLYVAYPASTAVPRPLKQLRGFKRITLTPGQKQTVTFALPGSALAYWDTTAKAFAVQPGTVQLQVGSTSKDVRAMADLTVAP
ncbi:MAG TPA: glycoside hydrolase family 3 C-terminal domain-containing protein [Polyangia bacterium]|nr:glycoside hydrolase family 3 C-terminal domain-containing protein [Polyangia bacterium]